jgi:hypothetical protein
MHFGAILLKAFVLATFKRFRNLLGGDFKVHFCGRILWKMGSVEGCVEDIEDCVEDIGGCLEGIGSSVEDATTA